jgi:restriction endonuclease S subunit
MPQGTATKCLTTEILKILNRLPELPVQHTITTILSALDTKIVNNKTINHNLEQIVHAIFKSWFIDFDPWHRVMPENWTIGKSEKNFGISIDKTPPRK